jgi:hypothetical protein
MDGMTVLLCIGLVLLYLLPIYLVGDKPQFNGVLAVNLFFGWTLVGWVVALVWACSPASAITLVSRAQDNEDRRPCPYCAEMIMRQAKVCRFCHKDL